MKYFNFVILLVLLSVGLVSLGFAGKAGVTSSQQTVQGKAQPSTVIGDPELRTGTPANRILNMETAQPPIRTQSVGAGSELIGGLTGTYTIPGDPPTGFPTLEAFASVYNFVGLSGNVIVELTNTSYLEDVVAFGPPQLGQDPDLTLTIKPATGTNVVVQFKTSNLEGKGFAFSGARNIIIDGINDLTTSLTLEYAAGFPFPSGDAFAATIYVTGGSQNITVQNTNIKGNINDPVWDNQTDGRPAVFVFMGADVLPNENITITRNTITWATFGLKALNTNFGDIQGPINYTYNKVGGAFGGKVMHGAIVDEVFGIHYDYNEIDGIYFVRHYWDNGPTEWDFVQTFAAPNSFLYDFGQHSGGHFYNMDAVSTFSYNYVNNIYGAQHNDGFAFIVYGMLMRVPNGSPVIHNNRIGGNINTLDGNGTITCLRAEVPIRHNSFRLTGAMLAGQTSYCVRPVGSAPLLNNAISNENSGGAVMRGIIGAPPNLSDGNAIFSLNGQAVGGYATPTAYLRAIGKDMHSVFGPVNFSADMHITAGPSSAEDIGITGLPVYADIDDEVRSLLTPDAGADEFADLGAPMAVDVLPGTIPVPLSSGIPAGVPQVPQVWVKNNSTTATIPFDVDLTIAGSGDAYGTKTVLGVTLAKGEGKIISFPPWIPVGAGARTLTATTKLVDVDPTNDVYTRPQPVAAAEVVVDPKIYNFDASAENWVGTTGPSATTDWKRSNSFTKLGGVFGAAGFSWVTEAPLLPAQYTEGAYASSQGYTATYPGPNLLTSPWLDLSTMGGTDLFISFSHSIAVEPDWDRSWLEYTTDGTNWHWIGKLNDPKGINWYSESVYEFAHSDDATGNIDEATLIQYGLIPDADALPIDTWASNGGASPTGPLGWVFVQLRVSPGDYTPEIVKAPVIKFRYVAFSDAATAFDGWAFDDFRLASTGASFIGGTISGTVFHDVSGNGVNDAEPLEPGLTVNLSYFGVPKGTTTTSDPGGTYTFNTATLNNGLPGVYNVQVVKPGFVTTLPISAYLIANVPHPGTGEALIQDFGTYEGSVSGVVLSEADGGFNFKTRRIQAGTPLGGWTVQLHKDTPDGTLVYSAVSDEDGEYKLLAPPYPTYVVTEVVQTASGRQNFPVGGSHSVSVSGNSGGTLANISGFNFGNFIWGKWTIEVTVDRNGNGVREPADFVPLPFGTDMEYYVYKDNVRIDTVTLGSGNSLNIRSTLDVGQYAVVRVTPIPTGWIQTTHVDSVVFDLATSGFNDTTNFLYFKLLTVSGVKFEDTNGNGTKDGVEPGLAGWTINVSGNGGGSQVTGVGGTYLFTGVEPGVHNVTETAQTGWVATSGPFNFTAASADLPVNNKVFDFGNFKQICVSGVKFRDRNNNGVKDAGEEGLAGWTINMPPKTPVVTGVDGSYEFCDVGAGAYTLTEVAQDGWLLTVPVSGQYDIVTVSGVDVTGLNFGNFNEADTALYRTFTYEQLSADLKKNKTPKVGKPILAAPNMANLEEQLMLELAAPKVGLAAVTDPVSGKIKPYLKPPKYGDIIKTLNAKGTFHDGTPKGFDVDNKGKIMTKLQKSMPPTKFNNMLTAQLLTLQVNLYASQLGHTPGGLGSLMYIWPGILNGLTIDEIADYGDEIMTNWAYVPKANYDSLYAGVKRINEAFSNTVVNDTVLGWFPLITTKPYSKSTWASYKTVYEVPCLGANPGVAPRVRPQGDPESMPVVYELGQNYPNPFNPTTTVEFSIPVDAFVTLKVYNLLGQEVATLVDHEAFFSGTEEVDFDASQLASGVYLYRIVAESINDDDVATGEVFTQVKKMVLVK